MKKSLILLESFLKVRKTTISKRKTIINEIVISFIAAIILKQIGNPVFLWKEAISWEYILRLLSIVIDVLVLWETVKYFTKIFDVKVAWKLEPNKRAIFQYGVVTLLSLVAIRGLLKINFL